MGVENKIIIKIVGKARDKSLNTTVIGARIRLIDIANIKNKRTNGISKKIVDLNPPPKNNDKLMTNISPINSGNIPVKTEAIVIVSIFTGMFFIILALLHSEFTP